MSAEEFANLLPAGLAARLERAIGASIASIKPRGGGGASRRGAEIVFNQATGELRAYLAYNAGRAATNTGELGGIEAFRREVAVLKALSGPLRGSGVRAPRFLAADEDTRAILTEFTVGEADYNKLTDEESQRKTSHDFMAQLAALHSIDIEAHTLDAFAPERPASQTIRERIDAMRANKLRRLRDPLIALALNWLEDNIPADPPRNVLLHGDAGPANFLYADGKVTALLDWELTHCGDPAADLAMIAIRNLFQPFIPLKEAFAAYEAAGGAKVDLDRVRYYRLLFQTAFASPPEALNLPGAGATPVFGTSLVFATVHMRVLVQALAEAAGLTLDPVSLPKAPPGAREGSFEAALADLKTFIVPRLSDQEARAKAKGLARLVKWWRDLERFGPAHEQEEMRELSDALGTTFTSVGEGRTMLCARVEARSIAPHTALQLCHSRVTRAAALFADAMGAFANTTFKPLD
ncbi:MAG: phosphotransferase family protein [Caulobacteraceae bacterium]